MKHTALAALAMTALLAACGGGGGTSSAPAIPAAPAAPTTAPTTTTQSVLSTAVLGGSPGFVNAAGMTVYVFDADLAFTSGSSCGGACATTWPLVAPPAGATMGGSWSSFVRTDGKTQLAFNTRPLYLYAGDSAPGQMNGEGINSFGGLWHVARPTASGTVNPNPNPTPTPGTINPGPY